MQKKQMTWKTRGMNRDLSVSAFNPEFSFENMNLRLSTNKGNTMMSWVNERGPSSLTLSIDTDPWLTEGDEGKKGPVSEITGTPVGTAVLNHQLVVFTHSEEPMDYIYCFSPGDDEKFHGRLLFRGNLNFNPKYPLETKESFETDQIQKVYWTDGLNQPRVINIAASEATLSKWNHVGDLTHGADEVETAFDFLPTLSFGEYMSVQKNSSGGMFAPGVIQYCFSYIYRNGQQSNIAQISPLYYISFTGRGASPEEKTSNSFQIIIDNLDTKFDCVRLYSIQRTSWNDVATVKMLGDFRTQSMTLNTGISSAIVYAGDGEDEDVTLPEQEMAGNVWKRIKTVNLTLGSYTLTKEILSDVTFKGTDEDKITLSNTLETTVPFKDFVSYFKGHTVHTKYYSYFRTPQSEIEAFKAEQGWEDGTYVYVNGKYQFYERQLYDKYFVYDYGEQCWYVTSDLPVVEEQGGTEKAISNFVVYQDNGLGGSSMDPTELLYIGGHQITALTMAEKDGTLFMGNIDEKSPDLSAVQSYFFDHQKDIDISFTNEAKQLKEDIPTGHYGYTSQLSSSNQDITTFKGGETYRFGFQLQKYTGEWCEPIFLKDVKNELYPDTGDVQDITIKLVSALGKLNVGEIAKVFGKDFYSTFRNIRPLVVFPNIGDRSVICQGVLNPTVFNALDRIDNSPFSQPSWFFRPFYGLFGESESTEVASDTSTYDYSIQPTVSVVDGQGAEAERGEGLTNSLTTVHIMLVQATDGTRYYFYPNNFKFNKTTEQYDSSGRLVSSSTSMQTIVTSVEVGRNLFALVSRQEWDDPRVEHRSYPNTNDRMAVRYALIPKEMVVGIGSSQVYSKLIEKQGNPLYYVRPYGNSPEVAHILFNIQHMDGGIRNYDIQYKNIDGSKLVLSSSAKGTGIVFEHYAPLPAYEKNSTEIQGNINPFTAVNLSPNGDHSPAATQFFVDQSIVTINSPEIEFDSDTQNLDMTGLALRIVGLIPITGYASSNSITHSAGKGSYKDYDIYTANLNKQAYKRLCAEHLWNDVDYSGIEDPDNPPKALSYKSYLVYPWQKTGSLGNDPRAEDKGTSWLKTKKESSLLFSCKPVFLKKVHRADFKNIEAQIHLWENDSVYNKRLGPQTAKFDAINYYPNIDKVIPSGDSAVSMKYKSGSHGVIALKPSNSDAVPVLPYPYALKGQASYSAGKVAEDNRFSTRSYSGTFWGKDVLVSQNRLDVGDYSFNDFGFLYLAELYRPDDTIYNRFGGVSYNALQGNVWQVGGKSASLSHIDEDGNIQLDWTVGDTYFQRYDCLKTYPFTPEDTNQLVEILSFMCETRVNIDGRYDQNRGQIDNTMMTPTNFNLWNPAYNQQDNFFTYMRAGGEDSSAKRYPNLIVYSKTKNSTADVDLWTNVTLASSLEMDGTKGSITSLQRLNDQLICLQEKGISQLLYNENMQMSTTEGVPIEIANSGKVQGKRYLSDIVGCSNKWSVVPSPNGLYFMDSIGKGIYLFNGQLQNISVSGGFDSWCKQAINSEVWNPAEFNSFVGYYDKLNQDVLFINKDTALAWSEKAGAFTSFYDYGSSPYFCNLDDVGIWLRSGEGNTTIWKHQAGEYGEFFWEKKPYWMSLIGNPDPQMDKLFTNLDFRACVDGDGRIDPTTGRFIPALPFGSLEVWDEYQHGFAELGNRDGRDALRHHTRDMQAALKRRFRIWRCDIPRDNCKLEGDMSGNEGYSKDSILGVSRYAYRPMDRMRNPWLYLRLRQDAGKVQGRMEMHDATMTYFV